MLHALIMAGGGGTRFWPRSRVQRPKQFLSLSGETSLLQQAHERLEVLVAPERTWIITGERYRDETAKQLPVLPSDQIIGEPCGRDTAPCIGLGAALIAQSDPDAIMMVTPADHVIEPVQEFRRTMQSAVQLVEEHPDSLITFGIPPTHPAMGYGYIHRGESMPGRLEIPTYRVRRFREKPKLPIAEQYVASGEYFWNSGIFVWKAKALLAQLQKQKPDIFEAVQKIAKAWPTPQRADVLGTTFPDIEKISIDFAVMEKAQERIMLQTPYRWDDVGSWLAVERMCPQDAQGNTVLAQHIGIETKNCVVVGESSHLLATVGVEDLLIVQDGDVTLIAHRSAEEKVKALVNKLQDEGLEKYL